MPLQATNAKLLEEKNQSKQNNPETTNSPANKKQAIRTKRARFMLLNAGAQPTPKAIGWSNRLSIRCLEGGDWNRAVDRDRFSKCLYALNFMHSLRGEV